MVIKSLEFKDVIQDIENLIKVFIISSPDDLEIANIDYLGNKVFTYQILVQTEPQVSNTILNTSENLIFVIGSDGLTKIGHLQHGQFVEMEDNEFADHLQVNILEVLMIAGDTGHFTMTG